MNAPDTELNPDLVHDVSARLHAEIGKVIAGQEHVINALMISLFCQGHCLLIGVPGLAKTLLVRSLAQSLGLQFSRIQFTPDLMPSDILGSEILHERSGSIEFDFQLGPVFTNLLLADEINRTPPKTQSALLEAMQERSVTVARETRILPNPFLVVATQNPIEHEGTYPLHGAQLDRFMFSINVGYPGKDVEVEIVRRTTDDARRATGTGRRRYPGGTARRRENRPRGAGGGSRPAVCGGSRGGHAPGEPGAAQVATDYIEWGAGPRASQYLTLGAKALALMSGHAAPEARHVRLVAPYVLPHRIVPNYRATGEGLKAADLVEKVLEQTPEPNYES